ncbi:hypothetical protein JAAARDRAFT_705279 [Jaapia argillacea MUCL 33604]|uniref:Uncharacterized protein n=1 Tax=Jaapia argillacea MUCL 33604 TaxID=933084 RepID=A0A067Q3V3_9AGAM|nr:hypothetical protein JAAARDRAFT_705279 [Jaapia argillacea MUCL 33604]
MRHSYPALGWEPVDAACRRFLYPESLPGGYREHELLILPTSFVGLGPDPSLDNPDIIRLVDNIYCPSARLLLITILRTLLKNKDMFRSLLFAWASYFYCYAGFERSSLDGVDVEHEVVDLWHMLVDVSS